MRRSLLALVIVLALAVPVAAGEVYIPLVQQAPAPTPTPTVTATLTLTATASYTSTPTATPTATADSYLVFNVIDGDTIDVLYGGTVYRVRYIGIDTPELSPEECYAQEAKARNQELVLGQHVTMVKDVSETDRYGRLLRYVYQGITFVNAQLVLEGYAVAAEYPPDTAFAEYFQDLQWMAMAAGSGMWSACATATPTATAPPTATVTPTATATWLTTSTPSATSWYMTSTPTPTRTATSAPPQSDLRITYLQYSGTDEYVKISNYGGSNQTMTAWKLVSEVGNQTYWFPSGYVLPAGDYVRIHSGPGASSNPPHDLKWTGAYIWNNDGDAAALYDSGGHLVDRWSY